MVKKEPPRDGTQIGDFISVMAFDEMVSLLVGVAAIAVVIIFCVFAGAAFALLSFIHR